MREAFVLRLNSDSRPAVGRLSGWIEEVDTGRELRFRTTEELLEFLGRCLDERRANRSAERENDNP
jgi:hypothetical protein